MTVLSLELSLEDLKAVIGESGLPNREELLAGLDAYDGHEPTLGFSFGMVKCELCGYEELIIYPVRVRTVRTADKLFHGGHRGHRHRIKQHHNSRVHRRHAQQAVAFFMPET